MRGWTFDEVTLARHGETEWNHLRRRQGQLDSPLTQEGLAGAARMAEALAGIGVDSVFCSPLGRARTTSDIIGRRLELPVTEVKDLAEVHHGSAAGLTNAEIEVRYPGLAERRRLDKYRFRFPDGESYADADDRARRALATMASTGARRPLIVSHEMIGRMLIRNLLGLPPAEALDWNHPHTIAIRFELPAGRVSGLDANGAQLQFSGKVWELPGGPLR